MFIMLITASMVNTQSDSIQYLVINVPLTGQLFYDNSIYSKIPNISSSSQLLLI